MKHDLTPVELGYISGFLDGEGSIGIARVFYGGRLRYLMSVNATNTDMVVLNKLKGWLGGWISKTSPSTSHNHIVYRWSINAIQAANILKILLPYLIIKQDRARLAIAFQDSQTRKRLRRPHGYGSLPMPQSYWDKQQHFFEEMKRLNLIHRGRSTLALLNPTG